ncbi:AraC family transcriptional regulator [Sphingomonas oligophenolica]|uniref:AraC family transcriptional regulator n=1 Tax=Sphingomonas oligophenolica TaxID=301154 RepID=A0ABU9Y6E5_9SPHN
MDVPWTTKAALRPGFDVAMISLIPSDTTEYADAVRWRDDEMLRVEVRLQGCAGVAGAFARNEGRRKGALMILAQLDGLDTVDACAAKGERSVILSCSRDFLSGAARQSRTPLPGLVGDLLDGRVSRSVERIVPTLRMRRIAKEMLDESPSARFPQMMREAKALELLCAALDQMVDRCGETRPLKRRDQARIDELCALLRADTGAKLSLSDLCRKLCWNETQMMECFKQVTGLTIANYRHRIIMERAYQRLNTSDASIAMISFEAGYDHPSNFTTAFKRAFGISPRAARQG